MQIDDIRKDAFTELPKVKNMDELEQFRIKYMGAKGLVKQLMGQIKTIAPEERKDFGQNANKLRVDLESAFDKIKAQLANQAGPKGPILDVTEPGLPPELGKPHILTQTVEELVDVFGRMGFDVETGPEVEDEYHNFIALNIPDSHPARDPVDNFYLKDNSDTASLRSEDKQVSPHLMRSQTSTIQIRVMEKTEPPIRVVAMGRVYRPDEHDDTHYSMFHQVEGLYVDRKVSMVDLKTTLMQFAKAYFGEEAEVRLRPSYFPFTEPSAELDIKMNIKGEWQWVEIGGCGMVDPNVFKAVGYDPEEWTGFAFGLGIERLAMRKYGVQDIRDFYRNDVRFLQQF